MYKVKTYHSTGFSYRSYSSMQQAEKYLENVKSYQADANYVELFNHKGDCLKSYEV